MDMKAKKAIILSIVVVLLLGCLAGCGVITTAEDDIKLGEFRNIPFGIKANVVNLLLTTDLKKQGYTEEPLTIDEEEMMPSTTYYDVSFYDYKANIELYFYNKENTRNFEDSIFFLGLYEIRLKDEDEVKIAYNYFYEKLKEKYGVGEDIDKSLSSEYNTINGAKGTAWSSDGTEIMLYRFYFDDIPINNKIIISYRSKALYKQIKENDKNRENEINNNINSGL